MRQQWADLAYLIAAQTLYSSDFVLEQAYVYANSRSGYRRLEALSAGPLTINDIRFAPFHVGVGQLIYVKLHAATTWIARIYSQLAIGYCVVVLKHKFIVCLLAAHVDRHSGLHVYCAARPRYPHMPMNRRRSIQLQPR